jgi:predicted ribosomally synthesized peptide with nif11-like leader
MSDAAARRFVERMKSDLDFFFRIAAIEDCEDRMAMIRAEGYDCTYDEVTAAYGAPFCD